MYSEGSRMYICERGRCLNDSEMVGVFNDSEGDTF